MHKIFFTVFELPTPSGVGLKDCLYKVGFSPTNPVWAKAPNLLFDIPHSTA